MEKELSISIVEGATSRVYTVTTTAQAIGPFGNSDIPCVINTSADIAVAVGDSPAAVYPTTSIDGNTHLPAGTFRTVVPASKKLSLIAKTGSVDVTITRGA